MRYQYVVILKKNSERATDVLSFLLCLFSALNFLYFAIGIPFAPTAQTWFLGLIAILLLAGLIINLITTRRRRRPVRYRYLLLLAAVGWIGMTTMPWGAAFFFLLAFLEYQPKHCFVWIPSPSLSLPLHSNG